MRRQMRDGSRPLGYANVVATLALIVALGGGAYAATKVGSDDIKRNAVRSKHVKKKAVKSKHLAPGAVRSETVLNDSLTGDDVNEASLAGLLGADRVLSNTVDATQETAEGRVLFRDPRTGLEVQVGEFARLRLVNTNAEAALTYKGIGFFSTNLYSVGDTLAPGEQDQIAFDATGFTYANLIVQRRSSQPGASTLQVTCMLEYSDPLPAMSCVGVG